MGYLKKIVLESKISFVFKPIVSLWRWFWITRVGMFIRFKPYQSDEKYIKCLFKKRFHKECDLEKPKTFNEKNNWRKLYDRKDIYTLMVDKYRVKGVIAERVGEKHAIPLLGVWEDPGDIDFDILPNRFVLKVNH